MCSSPHYLSASVSQGELSSASVISFPTVALWLQTVSNGTTNLVFLLFLCPLGYSRTVCLCVCKCAQKVNAQPTCLGFHLLTASTPACCNASRQGSTHIPDKYERTLSRATLVRSMPYTQCTVCSPGCNLTFQKRTQSSFKKYNDKILSWLLPRQPKKCNTPNRTPLEEEF